MSNLYSRVLVALIGIPALVGIILYGGIAFLVLIVLISTIGLWEFYRMAEQKGIFPNAVLGIVLGAMMQILYYVFSTDMVIPILVSNLIVAGILTLLSIATLLTELFRDKQNAMLNIASTIGGVVYVSLFFQCLLGIRMMPEILGMSGDMGGYFILTIFISIWLCDTAAYFAGRAFGKHKLFERVSPNKTWEGAIAGALAAVGGCVAVSAWLLPTMPVIHAVVLGAIVGTIGQVGDLAESLLKRDAGVKDSSQILAGHGGILDRFDSILMVSPVIYWYILIFR
ncbi:MAG: phosphatidate cytidylyltransferase [Ignavibacteria bacterium]|nr:phosphatidate cytidylyltransferase [Ignavibacteria bacterium]